MAIGDSTTEGMDDPDGEGGYIGWADRLALRLQSFDPEFRYANLAVRGRSVAQVRAEQLASACDQGPDLASVIAGVNDLMRPTCDVAAVVDHLDHMYGALRDLGATVLTITQPTPEVVMHLARPVHRRLLAYNDGIRDCARRHGLVLIDFARIPASTHPSLWSEDRLHLNTLGHTLAEETIAAHLGLVDPPSDNPPSNKPPSIKPPSNKPPSDNPAHPETALRYPAPGNTTPGDTARRDTALGDTAQRHMALGDTAQRDTVQRDTVQRDTAQRDTAQRDTARGHITLGDTALGDTALDDTALRYLALRYLALGETAAAGRAERWRAHAVWAQRYLAPYLWRHLRGRSSGDGRRPKRPIATPLCPAAGQPDVQRAAGRPDTHSRRRLPPP